MGEEGNPRNSIKVIGRTTVYICDEKLLILAVVTFRAEHGAHRRAETVHHHIV
jgi:hypothetical protein